MWWFLIEVVFACLGRKYFHLTCLPAKTLWLLVQLKTSQQGCNQSRLVLLLASYYLLPDLPMKLSNPIDSDLCLSYLDHTVRRSTELARRIYEKNVPLLIPTPQSK